MRKLCTYTLCLMLIAGVSFASSGAQFFAPILSGTVYNDFQSDASCISLYRFEPSALTTDSIGSATLQSFNSPSSAATYIEGLGAVDFTVGDNDYFSVTDANLPTGFPLKSGETNTDLTLLFWLNPKTTGEKYLIAKTNHEDSKRSLAVQCNVSNAVTLYVSGDGTTYQATTHSTYLTNNRFYHVAVVYKASTNSSLIRIWDQTNGTWLATNYGTIGTDVVVNDSPFYVGARSGGLYSADAIMDEVSIFNRGLSLSEIDAIRAGHFGFENANLSETMERGNLDMSNCSADAALAGITITPRKQENEYLTGDKWWYFYGKISGINGLRPTFTLVWSDHISGQPPKTSWMPCYSYTPTDIDSWVYATAKSTDIVGNTQWQFPTAFSQDDVYIAYRPIFTPSMIETKMTEWVATGLLSRTQSDINAGGANYQIGVLPATTNEIGTTIPALPLWAFKVGTGAKKAVLLGGIHPAEDHGTIALSAAIDWLLSADADAVSLRSNFTFWVYPMVNPQGRYGGDYRGTYQSGQTTVDPNRDWDSPVLTCVSTVRGAIVTDTTYPDVLIDYHGHFYNTDYTLVTSNSSGGDAIRTAYHAALETNLGDSVLLTEAVLTGYAISYFEGLGTALPIITEIYDVNADQVSEGATWGIETLRTLLDVVGSL